MSIFILAPRYNRSFLVIRWSFSKLKHYNSILEAFTSTYLYVFIITKETTSFKKNLLDVIIFSLLSQPWWPSPQDVIITWAISSRISNSSSWRHINHISNTRYMVREKSPKPLSYIHSSQCDDHLEYNPWTSSLSSSIFLILHLDLLKVTANCSLEFLLAILYHPCLN
jgi:hypothetical protein